MNKVEYPEEIVLDILRIIDTITITGIENIKKMSAIVHLLDSGKQILQEESDARTV